MIQYKLFTGGVFDNEVEYKKELGIWRNKKIDDIPSKFFNSYMKEFHSELTNKFELNFDKRQCDIEVTLLYPIQIIAKNKFINKIESHIRTKILVNSDIGIEDLAYVIKNMEDIITENNNIYSDSKVYVDLDNVFDKNIDTIPKARYCNEMFIIKDVSRETYGISIKCIKECEKWTD